MLAAYYERTGAARDVLRVAELPDPVPGAGEVRVRVQFSGVTPSDVKSRAGRPDQPMPFARVVPHSDGAGAIDAVGAGADAARIGERVWVWNAAWGRADGTAAQYVVLPAAQAVALPPACSLEAGACLGVPALTGLHALRCHGGVADQTVLVAGGAGSVGRYAIQFARILGARRVIASVSGAAKAAIAAQLGADETIDYRGEDLIERVRALTGGRGVDRVVEVDIAANGRKLAALLRAGGQAIVYGSGAPEFTLPFFPLIARNVSLHFFIVYHLADKDRAAAQALLTASLENGRLQHRIAECLPLHDIAAAHEIVAAGRASGNVILQIP